MRKPTETAIAIINISRTEYKFAWEQETVEMEFHINGESLRLQVEAGNKPLLWTLKEDLNIHHAKFGCGSGLCGACSVMVGEQVVRACVYPVSAVAGQKVRTVAGLNDQLGLLLKQAWEKFNVPQCGYCQPGFIMAAYRLILDHSEQETIPSDQLTNLCRCGTYPRIRLAIQEAHLNYRKAKEGEV